jgi:wobble nucleotide-excising tRNase
MPQINKLLSVNHPGVLRDFCWPDDLPPFAEYNVIYGWNGVGKTTISGILRSLEDRKPPSAGDGRLLVDTEELSFNRFPEATVPIRVFNRDYVNETVFPISGKELPLILILGKEDAELQKQIDTHAVSITSLSEQESRLEAEVQAKRRALEDHCVQMAKTIKDLLTTAGAGPFNNFNKKDYRGRIDEMIRSGTSDSAVLGDADYVRARLDCEARPTPVIDYRPTRLPELSPLHGEIGNLLREVVTATVIDDLRDDTDLSIWVRTGLEIHRDQDAKECLFCGAHLETDRIERLNKHFNSAFEGFLHRLDTAETECNRLKSEVRAALVFPDDAKLYEALQPDYGAAKATAIDHGDQLLAILDKFNEEICRKRAAPFTRLHSEIPVLGTNHEPLQRVSAVIDCHNSMSRDVDATRTAARNRLADHMIAESIQRYGELDIAAREAEGRLEGVSGDLCAKHDEVRRLRETIAAHVKPAKELNADLRDYLGHSELELVATPTGYRVERGGEKAHSLSEGEKTAIALLFYLKSLHDSTFDAPNGVAVLDDPITSLDARNLYSAFAFIRQRTQHMGQVFVLTHCHPLLRQVVSWFSELNGRKKESSLLAREPGDPIQPKARYWVIELLPAEFPRRSTLRQMNHFLRAWNSEYQYLFNRIRAAAADGIDRGIDDAYPLPNMARRVLEMFIAFRRPDRSGDFTGGLRGLGCDGIRTTRVLRFVHTFSHSDVVDEGGSDASCLLEASAVMKDVLSLIEEADEPHYKAMVALCETHAGHP